MSTDEQRVPFVEGLLSQWIDAEMTLEEMTKSAEVLADGLELALSHRDIVEEAMASHDKTANASVLLAAAQSLASRATDATLALSSNLIGKGVQKGLDVAPWLMAGGLVAPAAIGYYGGSMAGQMSEDSDEAAQTIKNREIIDTFREHAALARARNQSRQLRR